MSDAIRSRFAPSPTGFLHLGGARTATAAAALLQPVADRDGFRIVGGADVDVGCEPAVEPADKSAAERFHHGGDTDIDGEREQQRHQRQR